MLQRHAWTSQPTRLGFDVPQTISPSIAAMAIAVGVLATAMKLGRALFLGNRTFRLIAGGALGFMLLTLRMAFLLRQP